MKVQDNTVSKRVRAAVSALMLHDTLLLVFVYDLPFITVEKHKFPSLKLICYISSSLGEPSFFSSLVTLANSKACSSLLLSCESSRSDSVKKK